MQALIRDVRYGIRTLTKSPALFAISTIALTLGIGLTTTMFSIVYGALMKGLPYQDGDRIVAVQRHNPARGIERQQIPIQDYYDFKAQQRSFSDVAAATSGTIFISGEEKAERVDGTWITANGLTMLGVQPFVSLGKVSDVQAGSQHHDQGVDGIAEGVLPGDHALLEALGAGSLDVLHIEHIQQVGAHDAAQTGGAAKGDHHDRDPQVLQHIPKFCQAHRSVLKLVGI